MNEELIKALAKQGITIQWGFDGKPQYYKGGKMLTGKAHGDAALLHSRTSTQLQQKQTQKGIINGSQSPIAQLFDVTGISGWRDFKETVVDNWDKSSKLDKSLAVLGAIPGLSILNKPSKIVKKVITTTKPLKPIIDVAENTIKKTALIKKTTKVAQNLKLNNNSLLSTINKIKKEVNSKPSVSKDFKSEIDWGKWNPEIPDNTKLMQEYNAIEQQTKAAGTWMKSPDGSVFKGTPEQFVQQNSQNFKKAFGNSKVRNEDGSLIKMYHSSPKNNIKEFLTPKRLENFEQRTATTKDTDYTFFTPNKDNSKIYGDNTYEVYINSQNPINVSRIKGDTGLPIMFNPEQVKNKEFYDSITNLDFNNIKNELELSKVKGYSREIAIPYGNYVKSAIGNNGMFDMTNPNIYKGIAIPIGGAIGYGALNNEEKVSNQEFKLGGTVNNTSNMNKKSIKDLFAYGGTAMDIDSPSVSLVKAKRNTEQASFESQYDPLVMGLQGLGGTMMGAGLNMATMGINKMGGYEKLFDTIFGGNKAATGGTFGSQVEAEGGEVVETPDGQMQQLQGPSHEGGGIDMLVPPGTDFFSDRLKGPNGKTMANRKKERELKEAKLRKQLQKDPTNILLKKTLKKVQEDNAKINEQDLAQMNYVKDMMSHGEKFLAGGTSGYSNPLPIRKDPYKNIFAGLLNINGGYPDSDQDGIPEFIDASTGINQPIVKQQTVYAPATQEAEGKYGNASQGIQGTPSNSSMPTLGDMLGMAGNLISGFGPMRNTLKNRANTPIEKNAYENFGQKGLAKIQGQSQFIDGVRTNQLQDLELGRQASINRNNNSARGLNTQRALNLAVDAQANNTRANINDQFAQSMMQMMGLEANQLNAMDQAVMQGEDKRAERELQNTDNFYSNMAKDIASMGQGIANTGKALNKGKERDASMNVLRQIFPDIAVDRDGNTIVKENGQVTQVDKGTANVKENGKAIETKTVEPLYDKDGNMSKEGLAELAETPEVYSNFKGKDGKAITLEEYAKYLYSKSTNPKYTKPLEELDTTYKNKIDPTTKEKKLPFETFEDYQKALKGGWILEDIKKASTSTKKKTTTKKYRRR